MKKLDELIGADEMAATIGFNHETARRWCRLGVLHVHQRGGEKGVELQSYRGSVEVRKRAHGHLRSGRNGRDMTLDRLGKLLTTASGDDDEFIVERIRAGKKVDEIFGEFLPVLKRLLDAQRE